MSIRTPYLLAAGLTAAVAGWILSGDIVEGGREDARPPSIAERNENAGAKLFRVEARVFKAEPHVGTIEVRGSTEASGKVALRSETLGLLNARHVKKGDRVEPGDLICSLNIGAREAMVLQRKAELDKAQIEYDAALTLVGDGFATKARVNENKAAVEAALAALKSAEIELERTQIKAPISGIVQDPFAKVGDMLQVGDVCANIMQPDSMNMIAEVSERFIGQLSPGDGARVRLATGEDLTGRIVYIAPSANPETRTFRIEVALPNADGRIRDGVTAIASIALPGGTAHLLPASVLTLNDAGELGVRAIEGNGTVRFMPLKILDDTREGMWVSGLPQSAKIITRGQEYVVEGEQVDAVTKTAEAAQ